MISDHAGKYVNERQYQTNNRETQRAHARIPIAFRCECFLYDKLVGTVVIELGCDNSHEQGWPGHQGMVGWLHQMKPIRRTIFHLFPTSGEDLETGAAANDFHAEI